MRIAVLTLTRDRLPYTKHCFQTLRDNAGCDYDHYVLDNGSTDGTVEWLDEQWSSDQITAFSALQENIGLCRGLNLLLDEELNPADYDVIVRFDNDCEVFDPNTLRDIAKLSFERQAILSPHIHGLRNPPPVLNQIDNIGLTTHLGGIFMVIPAILFTLFGFRYDETQPPWAGDELICPWWRQLCGIVGYVDGYGANHYLSTDGQAADIPEYFARRVLEGGPAR